jgi:hypothetical protein
MMYFDIWFKLCFSWLVDGISTGANRDWCVIQPLIFCISTELLY